MEKIKRVKNYKVKIFLRQNVPISDIVWDPSLNINHFYSPLLKQSKISSMKSQKLCCSRSLGNRRGSNVGGFPVGNVGVHHARTKCLFAQLLAVEIEAEK